MLLSELSVGQIAAVTRVGGDGALRQHFLDMGLIPGAEVTLVKYAPMGDPMELRLHGYELTLRLDDAARIEIENPRNEEPHPTTAASRFGDTPHPAYGEGKSFQLHYKEEHSAPVETRLQFALVGKTAGKPRSLTSSRAPTNTSAIFRASPSTVRPAFSNSRPLPKSPTFPASIPCRPTAVRKSSPANSSCGKSPPPSSTSSTPRTLSATSTSPCS